MIIPVRCFTCGKVLADKYDAYVKACDALEEAVKKADAKGEAHPAVHTEGSFDRVSKNELLNDMGITRYCCRRHFLAQVDMMDVI